MKENQNNHYFNEWWEKQAIFFASSKGVSIKGFYPQEERIKVASAHPMGIYDYEPAPIFMMEWAAANPHPCTDRDEFIVALAKRVEALEAQLAQKGGDTSILFPYGDNLTTTNVSYLCEVLPRIKDNEAVEFMVDGKWYIATKKGGNQ